MPRFTPFGALYAPIGYRLDGSPIWPVIGGADDSTEGGGNQDGNKDGQTDDDSDDDTDDDDDDGSAEETKELPDNVKEILRKNRKALKDAQKEAKAAKKAKADSDAEIETYRDRDKTETDKAAERATKAEEELAKANKLNRTLSLRSAFLSDTQFAWNDPDDAFEIAKRRYDLDDLEIDDDGNVKDKKALKSLIKEMGKEKAYLVKSSASDGKDDDEDDKGKDKGRKRETRGASGGSFNGKSGNSKETDEDALAAKYPAMQGRRRVP